MKLLNVLESKCCEEWLRELFGLRKRRLRGDNRIMIPLFCESTERTNTYLTKLLFYVVLKSSGCQLTSNGDYLQHFVSVSQNSSLTQLIRIVQTHSVAEQSSCMLCLAADIHALSEFVRVQMQFKL